MVVNRLKYYVFGAHLMASFATPTLEWIQEVFPISVNGKLKDENVFVHSLGCSIWNTFGHEQGYTAIVECPAPGTFSADIRSDSGWFEKNATKPVCLIEFERYSGSANDPNKLESKLKNLLEAAQRWDDSPKYLILSVWNQGAINAPNTQQLKTICHSGFTSATGLTVKPITNTKVIFCRFLFRKNLVGASITLDRLHYEDLA
jgi:hypothetical protein